MRPLPAHTDSLERAGEALLMTRGTMSDKCKCVAARAAELDCKGCDGSELDTDDEAPRNKSVRVHTKGRANAALLPNKRLNLTTPCAAASGVRPCHTRPFVLQMLRLTRLQPPP